MSILYKVPGFEPATFGIESPPITTRPGLPSILLKARNWEYYYYYWINVFPTNHVTKLYSFGWTGFSENGQWTILFFQF